MKMVRVVVIGLAALLSTASPARSQDSSGETKHRPALLLPLYAGNVALHALDLHSTKLALQSGRREANPVLANASFNVMTAAKIAASAGTIVLVERLWKKNRVAAVCAMLSVNAGLSMVAVNNYRLRER